MEVKYQCPNCGSPMSISVPLLYEEGMHSGSIDGSVSGSTGGGSGKYAFNGGFNGGMHGSSRMQNEFASKFPPPEKPALKEYPDLPKDQMELLYKEIPAPKDPFISNIFVIIAYAGFIGFGISLWKWLFDDMSFMYAKISGITWVVSTICMMVSIVPMEKREAWKKVFEPRCEEQKKIYFKEITAENEKRMDDYNKELWNWQHSHLCKSCGHVWVQE